MRNIVILILLVLFSSLSLAESMSEKCTEEAVETKLATLEAERMLKETIEAIRRGTAPLSKYFYLEDKLEKYQLKLQLELREKAPEVFDPTMQELRSVFQKEGWLLPEDSIEFDVLVGDAREGRLAEFDISIKNNLEYPIVLVSLSTKNPYDKVYSWQKAQVGSVYYDEEKDLYVYDPSTEEATQNLFNEGLLFSSEALGLAQEYRVLKGEKEFKLDFVVLNRDRLWQVYLLKSRDGNKEVYERADQEKLGDYKVSYRSGIIFFDDGTGIRSKYFVSSYEVEPAGFPASAALKKLKLEAAPYTYSDALGGWVIKKGEKYFLVTPHQKIRLPELDLSVFDLIDEKERLRVELSSRARYYFKGVLYIEKMSSKYEDGFFADLDKKDLLKILRVAQENGLQVGLYYYFLDNARLLIR